MAAAGGGATGAIQRLQKEQLLVTKKPVEGVRFEPGEGNALEWTLFVDSPDEYVVGTERRKCPYAGRVFPVKVKFPENYPFKAPEIEFPPGMLYHPQVSAKDGSVCAEDIAKNFGPTKNVTDIARMVQNIMAQPNIETAPEADIMGEMRDKLATYEDKARRAAEKAPRK